MDGGKQNSSLSGFASYLAENSLLDQKAAEHALVKSQEEKISYIEYLLKIKTIDADKLAKAVSAYYGLPFCDLSAFNTDLIPVEFLNMQFVHKHIALPLFVKNGHLYLAVTDPTIEHIYDIRFLTGFDIRLLIAEDKQLSNTIDALLNSMIISEINTATQEKVPDLKLKHSDTSDTDIADYDVESAPVVNYVNKIISDAIEKNASDIHFERYEKEYRIRYRIYGILYPVASPPIKLANFLLARIKIMSTLDITEHRIPQDGRFKLSISKKKSIDFRVSVCPTLFGEKIVLRLLDPAQLNHSMDELGMEENQKNTFIDGLSHTQGMILVTGPTGSGKTVTLYTALSSLNSPEDNIMTVEDPVEIPLQGINQAHVNVKVGFTFATALRSFLRQDPDIIMVGEIRDLETAEICVKASQTGHLVLSTLHTNSGIETVVRLMNMGIAPYNVASSILLVVAQRLLRVLCKFCKEKESVPEKALLAEGFKKEDIGSFDVYKPVGCDRCTKGYNGRTGIFEVLKISEEMRQIILEGGSVIALRAQTQKEKMVTLKDSGLQKVKEGVTGLVELNRAFK